MKIWDKKKHWFNKKVRLIFGIIAILFFILSIISSLIWRSYILPTAILYIIAVIFACLALAPLIAKIPLN